MIKSVIKKVLFPQRFYRPRLVKQIARDTASYHSVLDVGCGRQPVLIETKRQYNQHQRVFGIDIFFPYLVENRGNFDIVVQGLAQLLPLKSKCVDCVTMIDVLEHLDVDAADAAFHELERVARKAIVIFTPSGFMPQEPYDGNPFQKHLSNWTAASLKRRGFRVVPDYVMFQKARRTLAKHKRCLQAMGVLERFFDRLPTMLRPVRYCTVLYAVKLL